MIKTLMKHSKVDLGVRETPLDFLPRLSKEIGVQLSVKRDDCLPFTLGGNKVRQLEYYLGPALETDSDCVLITGAIQSNFVRLCAAACRKLGLHPIVQLEQRVPKNDKVYNTSGNVLLNHLLGAEIHYFDKGEDEAAADANLDQIEEDLKKEGRRPYVIHLGIEYPPIGGFGYVAAAIELYKQFQKIDYWPDHIVVPSGSGLTHAGFLCGAKAIGWDVPIHGICVRRDAKLQNERITRRCREVTALLDLDRNVGGHDIRVWDKVLSPGYGQLNKKVMHAIELAAVHEGLLIDPVYSGRTLAGLISLVEDGTIGKGEKVTFIHTGGLAALFAYQHDLT